MAKEKWANKRKKDVWSKNIIIDYNGHHCKKILLGYQMIKDIILTENN